MQHVVKIIEPPSLEKGRTKGGENKSHKYKSRKPNPSGEGYLYEYWDNPGVWSAKREGPHEHVPHVPGPTSWWDKVGKERQRTYNETAKSGTPPKPDQTFSSHLFWGKFHNEDGSSTVSPEIKEQVLEENMPFIMGVAKKWRPYGSESALNIDDFRSEAMLGALQSLDTYKPGFTITSWMYNHIRRNLNRLSQFSMNRYYDLSDSERAAYKSFLEARETLTKKHGKEPDKEDFIREWNLPKSLIHKTSKVTEGEQVPDTGKYQASYGVTTGEATEKRNRAIEEAKSKMRDTLKEIDTDFGERKAQIEERFASHQKDSKNREARKAQFERQLEQVMEQSKADIAADPKRMTAILDERDRKVEDLKKKIKQWSSMTETERDRNLRLAEERRVRRRDEARREYGAVMEKYKATEWPSKSDYYRMFVAMENENPVKVDEVISNETGRVRTREVADSGEMSWAGHTMSHADVMDMVDEFRDTLNDVVGGLDKMNSQCEKEGKPPLGQILKLYFRLAPLPGEHWQATNPIDRDHLTYHTDTMPIPNIAQAVPIYAEREGKATGVAEEGSGKVPLSIKRKITAIGGEKGKPGLLDEGTLMAREGGYVQRGDLVRLRDLGHMIRNLGVDVNEFPEVTKSLDDPGHKDGIVAALTDKFELPPVQEHIFRAKPLRMVIDDGVSKAEHNIQLL